MGRCFCDGGKSLLPGMTQVLLIGQETIFKVPDLSKGAKFLACHVIIENRNISIMKLFILNSFIFLYPIRKALIS